MVVQESASMRRQLIVDLHRTDPKSTPQNKSFRLGYLNQMGILELRAPFKRLKKKFTVEHIISKMNTKKRKNLSSFVLTLIVFIQIRIAFAFCCSHLYREQDLISYFPNLIRIRVKEFIRARGQIFIRKG